MSKKLEQKQARREAEERKRAERAKAARKRNLTTLLVALLVGGLVVYLVLAERESSNVTDDFGVAADEANCTEIETQEDEGRGHVDEGTDVQYGSTPPTSGEHSSVTANPGFSSDPVAEENAVHNLEHGQIVIWYSPDAPQDVIDDIETYVDDGGIALLGIPYDQLPSGYNFAISAWGASQACEQVSGAVLGPFRERFQGLGPENVGIPRYEPETST